MNVGFKAWEAYLYMLEHEDFNELTYYRSLAPRFPEWKTELEIAVDALDECSKYGGFLWSRGIGWEEAGLEKFRSKDERKILADEGQKAMRKDMEAVEQFEKILKNENK